ncbi:MAG: hypothetical protein H6671_05540 [Anaerolineaceae bacterium]|nr:hypothetical protein [Anaerolineaceae bacterium]
MFEKMSRSWELVKASFSVLRSDKELLLYPIVSFIGVILVTISFAIPMVFAGIFDGLTKGDSNMGIASAIVGFLFYLVMYTVIIFSNTALVGAAMIRLDGGDPTLADGFRIARERFGKIIGYALISATVGMILRAISERGVVGQIVSSIIGFVWNVVTFLVVPVLVVEDIGPVDAVKRSGELLKKTWGEQLVANFGMGMVFGLLSFVILIPGIFLIIAAAGAKSVALLVLAVALLVILLIGIGLVSSALTGIFQAALYRYATQGSSGGFFNDDVLQGAFKPKRG